MMGQSPEPVEATCPVSVYGKLLLPNGTPSDLMISVCDSAADNCPTFPGQVDRVPLPFDDPAHAAGTQDEIFNVFRRVRDELRAMIEERFVAP